MKTTKRRPTSEINVGAETDAATVVAVRAGLLGEVGAAVAGGGRITVDLCGVSPRAHALQLVAACRKSLEAAGVSAMLTPRAEAALRGDRDDPLRDDADASMETRR